jgi:hypothetical protein
MNSPLTLLLRQIERTGSGPAEFWKCVWRDIDASGEAELQRLIMAIGMRGRSVRAMLAITAVRRT